MFYLYILGNLTRSSILLDCACHHVRRPICHWTRKYSVVPSVRVIQSIRPTTRYLHRHRRQLDRKLHRQHWLLATAGGTRRLRVHHFCSVAVVLHALYIQESARNEEQDYGGD